MNIEDYVALSRIRPALAACLTLFLLSLAGIPLTAGFFGKLYIFKAAVHSHLIGLTILGVLNSAVSVYYYLRLVVAMYMQESEEPSALAADPIPWGLRAALAVTVVGTIYLGILPGQLISLTNLAAIRLP